MPALIASTATGFRRPGLLLLFVDGPAMLLRLGRLDCAIGTIVQRAALLRLVRRFDAAVVDRATVLLRLAGRNVRALALNLTSGLVQPLAGSHGVVIDRAASRFRLVGRGDRAVIDGAAGFGYFRLGGIGLVRCVRSERESDDAGH